MTRKVIMTQTIPNEKPTDDPKFQEFLKQQARAKPHREKWEKIKTERKAAMKSLLPKQVDALQTAFKTLSSVEFSCREMFDLTMEDMRNISKAEGLLHENFPGICKREGHTHD